MGDQSSQRWLAVDHHTNTGLAYVFARRKDVVFKELKALLDPLGIGRYYTDDCGAYARHLDLEKPIWTGSLRCVAQFKCSHEIGKRNTQKTERKSLNLHTWIKRLTRKTLCFSKLKWMHDTTIGLLINKVEFNRDIHAKIQV